ncbi:MAG: GDSL-type esterase/lipase family protein [Nitrospira sp.]|jgi:lysophospholipase L1-like esterase|nr:GDSL-type esterase/lipase family protein [Nitrospira sp.]
MYQRSFPALFCLTLWLGSTLSPIGCTVAAADQITAVVPAPQTQAWWTERHERAVARLQQSPVDLLFIGDSITQGWEEAGRRVWETFYGRRRAANLGFNGGQTNNVLWRLQHGGLDGIAPKLAIVMIGTNNTSVRKDPPEQTAAGIHAILTTLHTRLPQTKILLLAVFPRGWSADEPLRLVNQALNERLRAYADQRQVLFLDLGPHFLDKAGRLSEEVMPDALHPSERGYRLWAEGMEHLVKPLLGE